MGSDSLGDLIRAMLVTYLDVKPDGLMLGKGQQPLPQVTTRFLATSPARTLYRERRPVCRSLDGLRGYGGKDCSSCPDRSGCTPQARLDIDIDRRPYRLLLAFTSARNFLLFAQQLSNEGRDLTKEPAFSIRVLDRGRWGELRFDLPTEQAYSQAAGP
jgi:hypothetical protein